jgi:hypothetical protein
MIINIPTNNDFSLRADVSLWSGHESLELDGRVISTKSGLTVVSVHTFDRVEDGRNVRYEVNFVSGYWTPGYILRRDGVIVSHG